MAYEQNQLRGQGFGQATGVVDAASRNRVLRNTYWLLALSMVPTVLGAWLGSDTDAILALLRKFARTAAETESEIRNAVFNGDLAAAAAAAHKLNGAARTVGANGVAKAAAGIERAGKSGDKAGCSDALGPLAVELRCIAAAINDN